MSYMSNTMEYMQVQIWVEELDQIYTWIIQRYNRNYKEISDNREGIQ